MGDYLREIELNNNKCLKIYQSELGDVGCVVWDAALVLLKYLDSPKQTQELNGQNVIELGSGTGAVGLTAAIHGANVILTDLEECQDLLNKNIKTNRSLLKGSVSAELGVWGTPSANQLPIPHKLLVADCLYYEQSLDPLLSTLRALSNHETQILFSYEIRETPRALAIQNAFFEKAGREYLIEQVPSENLDPDYQSPDIKVLRMKKL